MANTKLIVLKSKEILYTAVFIGLVVLMIIILKSMFSPSDDQKNAKADGNVTRETSTVQPDETSEPEENAENVQPSKQAGTSPSDVHYNPGTYSATLSMGDGSVSVMVTCNEEAVTSVALSNMDEAVRTMYPLMEETIQDINAQLEYVDSIDGITCSSENVYTTTVICNAIKEALTAAVR